MKVHSIFLILSALIYIASTLLIIYGIKYNEQFISSGVYLALGNTPNLIVYFWNIKKERKNENDQ